MLFFIWNFFICMTFHACKYCILFQFIHAIWFVWRNVGCWECGMLGKGHIEHVGFWGYVDVGDVEFGGFRMFRMWDVWNVGCLGYGMFGIWDVGCGMFVGMWDVDLQNTYLVDLLIYIFAEDLSQSTSRKNKKKL